MLIALAWRNIWRNRRRTLITLAALTLGSFGIVAMHSWRESIFKQLAETITAQLVGDIQIHGKGYQATPEVGNLVRDPVAVEAKLAQAVPGATAERRVLGAGLGGGEESSAGVLIMGVEPGTGAGALDVKKGAGLPKEATHTVVIGTELANQLSLDVGGEIVLVGQAADGSVANDRYTVAGLADAGTMELNATAVFMHIADAQDFFGLGDGVHQLIVHLPEPANGGHASHEASDEAGPLTALKAALDLRAVEAMSWNELMPELTGTVEAKRQGQYSMDFVIFLIVALGVLNTMTMSTFERTREIGVMLALGTRPRRVLAMIVLEAMLQGALGLAVGAGLAALGVLLIGDLHMESLAQGDFMGVRFPTDIHLALDAKSIAAAAVTVFATMLAGGFLPAWRAARLPAVSAMRGD